MLLEVQVCIFKVEQDCGRGIAPILVHVATEPSERRAHGVKWVKKIGGRGLAVVWPWFGQQHLLAEQFLAVSSTAFRSLSHLTW